MQVGVDVSRDEAHRAARSARRPATVDPLIVSALGIVVYASPQAATDFPGAATGLVFTAQQPRLHELARATWRHRRDAADTR